MVVADNVQRKLQIKTKTRRNDYWSKEEEMELRKGRDKRTNERI